MAEERKTRWIYGGLLCVLLCNVGFAEDRDSVPREKETPEHPQQ